MIEFTLTSHCANYFKNFKNGRGKTSQVENNSSSRSLEKVSFKSLKNIQRKYGKKLVQRKLWEITERTVKL